MILLEPDVGRGRSLSVVENSEVAGEVGHALRKARTAAIMEQQTEEEEQEGEAELSQAQVINSLISQVRSSGRFKRS